MSTAIGSRSTRHPPVTRTRSPLNRNRYGLPWRRSTAGPSSSSGRGDPANDELESSPLWKGLTAVKEGRLARVKPDSWLQGSTISAGLVIDDVESAMAG